MSQQRDSWAPALFHRAEVPVAETADDPRGPWPGRDVLEEIVDARRIARVDGVLRQRVVSVVPLFEHMDDPHNVGACLRTCEAYGLHDAWVVQRAEVGKRASPTAMSAQRWLDVRHCEDVHEAIDRLRGDGFELWVSDLEATEGLPAMALPERVALAFGNEAAGISPTLRAAADRRYRLPMHGMVQSLNLSVACAVTLEQVVPRRRAALAERGYPGDMPMARMARVRRRWLEHGVRNARAVRAAYGDPDPDA